MNLMEAVYNRSPIPLQNLMVSVRGWQYRYRRAGDQLIAGQTEFLLKSQGWDTDQFLGYQVKQLRAILSVAFAHVPYYQQLQRRLGCSPEDFKRVEDLRDLPILDKQTVRGNEPYLLNASIDLESCTHVFTSGTTGTPINVYESRDAFSKRMGFVARLRQWSGLPEPLYPRRAQFTGRGIVPPQQPSEKRIFWRMNRPGRSLLLSTTHISSETAVDYARILCSFEPELIDGYPSALLIIARMARRKNIRLPRPIAIITSAETLFPEDRAELTEAFGCTVHNQYAASEPSCFWCDCEHGNMHVNMEYGISEIVDSSGNPAEPGTEGEVVVTSFLNPVMPLIRYRLGDLATLKPNFSCKCGRRMPVVEQVTGRVDDILYVPERGYVGRLDPVFKGLGEIIEAQLIQEDLDLLRVLLVPDEHYNIAIQLRLLTNLRSKLGDGIKIEFETVEEIPRGPNGKFRTVVSKVKHLYPHPM